MRAQFSNFRLFALALALPLVLGACASDDDDLRGNEVAIDFVNESPNRVFVYINGEFFGDVAAGTQRSFTLGFGVFAVAVDPDGDGDPRRIPFQYVGLRPLQRTLMVFRSTLGPRPLFFGEAELTFRNDSASPVQLFLNGARIGEVPAAGAATIVVFEGAIDLDVEVPGDGLPPIRYQNIFLRAGQRGLTVYR